MEARRGVAIRISFFLNEMKRRTAGKLGGIESLVGAISFKLVPLSSPSVRLTIVRSLSLSLLMIFLHTATGHGTNSSSSYCSKLGFKI